eukprot:g6098.t1
MAMQRANAATQLPEAVRPDFSGRYIRAIFVASNVRQGGHGFYSTESEWEKAKVHLLLELDLRLVENSEVQKLKLCTAQDLEGVPTEMIVESMLRLESDEKAWDDVLKTGSWPQLQWEKCDFGRNGPSEEFLPEEAEEEVASVDHPEKPQPTIGMSSRCFTRLSRCIVRESETAQVIPSRCCTHVAMRNEDGKRLDGSLDYGGQDLDAAILPPLAQGKDMEVLYADWCRHLPASAWQSLENAQWPELKVAVFDDSFHMDSQGLEGAPALLQLLARCPRLKSIKLSFCGGIAAEAWEALRAAEWPQLKEARWEMCFESGKPASGGAGIVMELLARCQRLEKIDLSRCKGIAAEAFQLLGAADWPELRSAGFNDSFVGSNRSALPAVLQMLSRCPKVEHLNFYDCGVTEKELQKLPGGCWPHLEIQKCNGFDGEEKLKQLRRLKGADATEAASSAVIVIEDAMTQEADAEAKQPKRRKKVRSVRRRKPAETEAPNDAGDVSQIEGVCGDLEAERPIEAKEEERPEAPKKKRTSKKATRSVKKLQRSLTPSDSSRFFMEQIRSQTYPEVTYLAGRCWRSEALEWIRRTPPLGEELQAPWRRCCLAWIHRFSMAILMIHLQDRRGVARRQPRRAAWSGGL